MAVSIHRASLVDSEDPADNPSVSSAESLAWQDGPRNCLWCFAEAREADLVSLPLVPGRCMKAFCSFPCAAAFNQESNIFRQTRSAVYTELNENYHKVYPHAGPLRCAPHPATKRRFGGKLTDEEYAEYLTEAETKRVSPLMYPYTEKALPYVLETDICRVGNLDNAPMTLPESVIKRFGDILTIERASCLNK